MSPAEETDSLSSLEQRIQQAVHLVARLRGERDAAIEEAAGAKAEAADAKAEAARLAEEIRALQSDRKQVRQRIEKLLGQIDQLDAG
jgi:FtsZ-binding cell division protein ZapB